MERTVSKDHIYTSIKAQLLDGMFMPGERLDATMLANDHDASITPVRSALYRLSVERLVEFHPNEGFHAASITEAGLRELYAWTERELAKSLWFAQRLEAQARPVVHALLLMKGQDQDVVAATAELFLKIAELSDNRECRWAIAGANDRLQRVRTLESNFIADRAEELRHLSECLRLEDFSDLAQRLDTYHQRRIPLVADLVKRLMLPQR